MKKEYIEVEDGWGSRRVIPADKLPQAQEIYQEMRVWSRKAGNPEEVTNKYTIVRITKVEE